MLKHLSLAGLPAAMIAGSMLLVKCDPLPVKFEGELAAENCQTCHASPPATGSHLLHLYQQNSRQSISCDECHASSVMGMIRRPRVTLKSLYTYNKWLKVKHTSSTLELSEPGVSIRQYDYCFESQFQGDSLFTARVDSFAVPLVNIADKDSLALTSLEIIHYPYLNSVFTTDTLQDEFFGPIIYESEFRNYSEPIAYDNCETSFKNGILYSSQFDGVDSLLTVLGEIDSIVVLPALHKIIHLVPNNSNLKKDSFQLKDPDETGIYSILRDSLDQFVSIVDNKEVLLDSNGNLYRFGESQLYQLKIDSVLDYTLPVFAATGVDHGNGKVDILFAHESTTVYSEDTTRVILDPVTGDVTDFIISISGAWNPVKQTCWSEEIQTAQCHTRISGEFKWYGNGP